MCFDTFRACFGMRNSGGWRKASKCKRVIKKVWSELKIEKNRMNSIRKQSQTDIGQLLKNNQDQEAFAKVEQLYKDLCLKFAYDQLDNFSVHVYIHLPTISQESVLPTKVSEAVSSLIYAAPICGKLPGLQFLRNLFEERYGSEFVKINIELLPGNLVNIQTKEHLCMESVPDDVILRLTSEIASDQNLNQTPEDIKLRFKLQQKNNIVNTNHEAELEKKPSDLEKQEECDIDAGGLTQISEFKKQIHDAAYGMEDLEESSTRTTSKDSYQSSNVAYLNDTEENQWVPKGSFKEDLSSLKSWDGNTGLMKSSAERNIKRKWNQFENSSTWVSLSRKEVEYAMHYGESCEDENNNSCRFQNQKMLTENGLSLQSLYV